MFNPMQSSRLCYLELTNGHFVANAKLTTMVEVAVTQTYMLALCGMLFQQNSDLLFLRHPWTSISGNGTRYYVFWIFVDPLQCNADQSE